MASFCEKCGFPQSANSTFCAQCGGRLHNAAPVAPPVPAATGGSGLKILMVILVCFAVAGIAVVGGLYYIGHRVKQAVVHQAAVNGVDLSALTTPPTRPAKHYKACDLLSKDEAGRMLGEPIDRILEEGETCSYFGPPGLSARLAQEQASRTFHRAQTPGSQVGGTEVANAVDQLVNNMAAQSGQAGSGGDMPLLILVVGGDGKAQMTALSATKAIFGGIGAASDPKGGLSMGADIPGLGDRAIRLSKLGLNVLSGDNIIRLITGPVPEADPKSIDIARAVLARM